jgi:hypothetical protein
MVRPAQHKTFEEMRHQMRHGPNLFMDEVGNSKLDMTPSRVDLKVGHNPADKIREVYDGRTRIYAGGKPTERSGYRPPLEDYRGDGDGLATKAEHAYEVKIQKPQFREDQRHPNYDNDVALDWRRGMADHQACGKPFYDFTGLPKNARGGSANSASGQDMPRSPLSAAAYSQTPRQASLEAGYRVKGPRNDTSEFD